MTYEDKIIPAGTKIVFGAHAGQAGTDTWNFFITMHDYKDSYIADMAWQFGLDHAEMYGVYPVTDDLSEDDLMDTETFSENIEGWYEIYDPEEHDGHRVGNDTSWNSI